MRAVVLLDQKIMLPTEVVQQVLVLVAVEVVTIQVTLEAVLLQLVVAVVVTALVKLVLDRLAAVAVLVLLS